MSETRLWGARFRSPPDEALMKLSRGGLDHFRLTRFDIVSSQAHARELLRAGVLDAAECQAIVAKLGELDAAIARGAVTPLPADEDVHTFMERVLVEALGVTGAKLRAGRSRNDQAANNLKLYLREQSRVIGAMLLDLQDALMQQAGRHLHTLAPGFTHLQAAQPVVFAHQLLAHAQTFSRDFSRLQDWDRRSARSPLGAAAMAGSAIAVQPEISAAELGYDGPCENSIDAVGSRDHVAEFLFVCAMLGTHLSRLSEEVTLWVSRQFRWVDLDDAFSTGSSIMPQKKNPDIAELTRGRSARLISLMMDMLVALKGLPFSYNRDLSEDKYAAFEAIDVLHMVLPAMAGMMRTLRVNEERMRADATQGFTLATEVADWLSRRGVPFAQAHEITGAMVRRCEDLGLELHQLSDADMTAISEHLKPGVREVLTPEAAVAARSGYGGTAPQQVQAQLERLGATVARQRAWSQQSVLPAGDAA
ncbi:MAG: Argininosuccinate lyase [Herbaspirillum frisingense]|uniref:Argininosuccinate lyase n=1 Tax=Herbaspirillum frisingense TaxID=92645 RepID=A0A7V8JUR8_9BURK|nr:MAG: Argininosuccinate lyase [Herbaspirillum frisingense]